MGDEKGKRGGVEHCWRRLEVRQVPSSVVVSTGEGGGEKGVGGMVAGPPCRWRRCRLWPTFCTERDPARMALEGARAGLPQEQARKEVAQQKRWEGPEGSRRAP